MQVSTQRFIYRLGSVLPALTIALALYGFGRWYDPLELSGPNLFNAPITFPAAKLASDWSGFGALAAQTPEGILVLHANSKESGRLTRPLEPVIPGALFRLRGYAAAEQLTPGVRPWERGRVMLIYQDHTGRTQWYYPHTAISMKGTQDWTAFEWLSSVPGFAMSGGLMVVNQGRSGRFKVKEMSLEPMAFKRSNRGLDVVWVVLWCGVAFWYSRRLGLWSRPAGWLILLLNAGVVIGMLIPSSVIKTAHLEVTEAVEHQIQRMTPHAAERTGNAASKRSDRIAIIRSKAVAQWMNSWEPHRLGHLVMFLAMGYSCSLMFLSGDAPSRISQLSWKYGFVLPALVGGMAVYAATTELLQVLVINRSPSLHDWWLNMQGFAIGTLGFMLTHGARCVASYFQRS